LTRIPTLTFPPEVVKGSVNLGHVGKFTRSDFRVILCYPENDLDSRKRRSPVLFVAPFLIGARFGHAAVDFLRPRSFNLVVQRRLEQMSPRRRTRSGRIAKRCKQLDADICETNRRAPVRAAKHQRADTKNSDVIVLARARCDAGVRQLLQHRLGLAFR
jgi:hypothetical protein